MAEKDQHTTPGSSSMTEINSPTSASATPDPLNTAFINDTTVVSEQSQHSLSSTQQDQGYNTIDTSTVNSSFLEALVESPAETIDLCTPSIEAAPTVGSEIIDLTTPAPAAITIDLCTPNTIDLCTPESSTTNATDQNKDESPLRLKPK